MVRGLIAEDEPLARRTLRELAGEVDWLEIVGEAEDGREALRMINKLEPDLVFLDVQMPELSGVEVLERVEHVPAVVFTTAFDKYAVVAFELEAVDYLVKPFGRKRFRETLERVRRRLVTPEPASRMAAGERPGEASGHLRRLFARRGNTIVPFAVDGVMRFEAGQSYVAAYTGGGKFLLGISLTDLEQRLDHERFRRVHRAHIVNLDYVAAIEPYDDRRVVIRMSDGSAVVASRSGSQALRGLAI